MIRAGLHTVKEISRMQVFRFLAVGVFSVLIEFVIFAVLVDYTTLPYTYANIIAMGVSIVCNYQLTRSFVFETGRYSGKTTFSLFLVFTLVGVLLNQFLLWFMAENTAIHIMAIKAMTISMVAVFNYFAKKHIVFRQ